MFSMRFVTWLLKTIKNTSFHHCWKLKLVFGPRSNYCSFNLDYRMSTVVLVVKKLLTSQAVNGGQFKMLKMMKVKLLIKAEKECFTYLSDVFQMCLVKEKNHKGEGPCWHRELYVWESWTDPTSCHRMHVQLGSKQRGKWAIQYLLWYQLGQ